MAPALLVAGRICCDELLELAAWPQPDTKTHLKASLKTVGGNAARAAITAARLGATVGLAGRVGDDEAGRFCLTQLQAAGVDTSLVKSVAGGVTPHSHVLVCGATRTVLAETNRLAPMALHDNLLAAARQSAVLLLDPAAAHLAVALKRAGSAVLVYDHEPAAYDQDRLFKLADWFVPSLGSLNLEPGREKALAELAGRVAGRLIVTAGAQGAYLNDSTGLRLVAAPQLEVIDTTGAGDNFHGALAVALAGGADAEQAARLAVAVASLSCRNLGCPPPDLNEAAALASQLRISDL